MNQNDRNRLRGTFLEAAANTPGDRVLEGTDVSVRVLLERIADDEGIYEQTDALLATGEITFDKFLINLRKQLGLQP